jgi:hypothetical protein
MLACSLRICAGGCLRVSRPRGLSVSMRTRSGLRLRETAKPFPHSMGCVSIIDLKRAGANHFGPNIMVMSYQQTGPAEFTKLYQPPENLTPGGFPNSRKRDSIQHVVDSRSGRRVAMSGTPSWPNPRSSPQSEPEIGHRSRFRAVGITFVEGARAAALTGRPDRRLRNLAWPNGRLEPGRLEAVSRLRRACGLRPPRVRQSKRRSAARLQRPRTRTIRMPIVGGSCRSPALRGWR